MDDLLAALPSALRKLNKVPIAHEAMVFAAFGRCVGEALADRVIPARLEGTRLIAAVENETWRRNVSDLGPTIVRKMDATVGKGLVTYVEFKVIPEEFNARRKSKTEVTVEEIVAVQAPKQVSAGLAEAADSISDPELKDRFLRAAGSSLARRAIDADR